METLAPPEAVSRYEINNLFAVQDTAALRDDLALRAGDDLIPELVAAHFLRPAYENGASPEKGFEDGDLLGERVRALDLGDIEDAEIRSALEDIQRKCFGASPDFDDMPDPFVIAARLVPGLVNKYDTSTAMSIAETYATRALYHASEDNATAMRVYSIVSERHVDPEVGSTLALALKNSNMPFAELLFTVTRLQPGTQALLGGVGRPVLEDLIKGAARYTDSRDIRHYTEKIEQLSEDLEPIAAIPGLQEQFEEFVNAQDSNSVKQANRRIQAFKGLALLGENYVDKGQDIEGIERIVIDKLLGQLTQQAITTNPEEHQRLMDRLQTITPFLTYCMDHLDRPDYSQALAEIFTSIANGAYEEWRRGDGSVEWLNKQKEIGYLPENLMPEQYVEWTNDMSITTLEELSGSASDAALAIKSQLEHGEQDLAEFTDGYSLDPSQLPRFRETRKNLGRLVGAINQVCQGSGGALNEEQITRLKDMVAEAASTTEVDHMLGLLSDGETAEDVKARIEGLRGRLDLVRLLVRLANLKPEEIAHNMLYSEDPSGSGNSPGKPEGKLSDAIARLRSELPPGLEFLPSSAQDILDNFNEANPQQERFTVEETIDPKVTIEIGETPQRTCQHYQTGVKNEGLIGYFGPEVKILIVKDQKDRIVGRSIMRLMEDENGNGTLYTEPVYKSVASSKVDDMLKTIAEKKAAEMGIELFGSFKEENTSQTVLRVRKMRMPATYSDTANGINSGSMRVYIEKYGAINQTPPAEGAFIDFFENPELLEDID